MVGALLKWKIWRKCVEVLYTSQLEEVKLMNIIDFPGTEEIFLEKNYRSTASILRSSVAIVAEGRTFSFCPDQLLNSFQIKSVSQKR